MTKSAKQSMKLYMTQNVKPNMNSNVKLNMNKTVTPSMKKSVRSPAMPSQPMDLQSPCANRFLNNSAVISQERLPFRNVKMFPDKSVSKFQNKYPVKLPG